MTLKVIGAGFGRTGTASLKIALEKLLRSTCYHMSELLGNTGHVDLWLAAAAGKPDWSTIFDGYEATVDFPAATYWRELAAAFPDAKILLSVRDADRWVASTQRTIFSKTLQQISEGTKWDRMLRATIYDPLGGDVNDLTAIRNAFLAHNMAIEASIDPKRLLIFEAEAGWRPLATFLGVEAPDEPFPRVNSHEEFNKLFDMLRSPAGPRLMNGDGAAGTDSMHAELFKNE